MHNVRVAVCGAGISGATAARVLAQNGCSVTVFESGFGVGGRSATRQARQEPAPAREGGGGGGEADGEGARRYQFDHGAQYISAPKTAEFAAMLSAWRAEGFVGEWRGAWTAIDATASPPGLLLLGGGGGGGGGDRGHAGQERWVGVPRMSSIAEGLLGHGSIQTRTRSKARIGAFSADA